MDIFSNLALGFGVAVTLQNLAYCFIGVFLGTLIGVLPGIGPVATVAMLLPLTFNLNPATSMIMLAGIYYGAQYGGSTTAILVNIPGESSSVVTTIDGHAMAKQGRAGPALGIAAIASFVAGSIATLVVALFSPPLAEIALKFQPARTPSGKNNRRAGTSVRSPPAVVRTTRPPGWRRCRRQTMRWRRCQARGRRGPAWPWRGRRWWLRLRTTRPEC